MKRVILRGPRDMIIEDFEANTSNLGPHDMYVETEITALKLGTDRGNWEGEASIPGAPNEFPDGSATATLERLWPSAVR